MSKHQVIWLLITAVAAAACSADGPQRARKGRTSKVVVAKSAMAPSVSADGKSLSWGGPALRPIDDGGVYYYDPAESPGVPMPSPSTSLRDIVARHGLHGVVRCKLADYVECSGTDHGFSDDGRSRVLRLADGDLYRVTAPTKPLSLFSYILETRAQPGRPQLMVLQLINDRERYTSANLRLAEDAPWADPYRGAEEYQPQSQEGGTMRLDVGACLYTGREYPCDGRPVFFPMLFYPKGDRIKVIISHHAAELDADVTSGAAVARIWLFDILDPLPPALDAKPAPDERRIGLYYPHPWFLYDRFGVPSRTREERVASLTAFADYMAFCGFNQLQFHIINGSDTASRAWYDSKLYEMNQGNLVEEFLPLAERRGIQFVPIVTPIFTTIGDESKATDQPDKHGFCRLSLQVDAKGDYVRQMGRLAPDPLRPEVQNWLINCFKEILDRCSKSPAVPAVGFRVNGKIGLCYGSRALSWPNVQCGQDMGYSDWDIAEFEKDTGIQVPRLKPTPYEWLRNNAWEQWIEWRCVRMREFWLKVRDVVRSYRADLKLLVATDLPSEMPGYNIEWPAGISVRDLFRHHGYDPDLYRNDEGIIIQRCMMINSDRFWTNTYWPHYLNVWAHKEFNYVPEVAESYRTREDQWVEFYHNYWEEHPHPDNQYGNMRTCTGAPAGDLIFEPATYSLRATNATSMAFMGWERPSAGHENVFRRFARAFRAIPPCEPRDFDGKVEIISSGEDKMPALKGPNGDRYARAASGPLWVKYHGSRLVVMNDASFPREVRLTLPRAPSSNETLYEFGAGAEARLNGAALRVALAPHDLRVYEIRPKSAVAGAAPTPPPARPATLRVGGNNGAIIAGVPQKLVLMVRNSGRGRISAGELHVLLPETWRRTVESARPEDLWEARFQTPVLKAGQEKRFEVEVVARASDAGKALPVQIELKVAGKTIIAERALVYVRPAVDVSAHGELAIVEAGEQIPVTIAFKREIPDAELGTIEFRIGETRLLAADALSPTGSEGRITVELTVPGGLPPGLHTAEVWLKSSGYDRKVGEVSVHVPLKCPSASRKLQMDGDLADWRELSNVASVGSDRFEGGDAAGQWGHRQQPELFLTWDQDYLYAACRADRRSQSDKDMFDLSLDSKVGPAYRTAGYSQYTIVRDPSGVKLSHSLSAPASYVETQARFAAVRSEDAGGRVVFEMAVPWREIGIPPQAGAILGIACRVVQIKGGDRRELTWGGGVGSDRDWPEMVRLLLTQ